MNRRGIRDWRLGISRQNAKCKMQNAPSRSNGPHSYHSVRARHSSFIIHHSSIPFAFTLVELLVTITIIGILAGMVLGAVQMARQGAREYATKATIAKLNSIIMERYESYLTRRVPISTAGLTPRQAAEVRLGAIRDLMRMEMPERWTDIEDAPGVLPYLPSGQNTLREPALHLLYRNKYQPDPSDPSTITVNANYSHAKCLYLIVSMGSPEAMEQFSQSEIRTDPDDGWSYFVDGWERPIYFLRWAPSFASDIQVADFTNHHDPFDSRNVDLTGYQLIPLIVSFGRDANDAAFVGGNIFGNLEMGANVHFPDPGNSNIVRTSICDDAAYQNNGRADLTYGAGAPGNITNHHIEQR